VEVVTRRAEETKLPLTQTSSPFKPIHTFIYTTWPCIKKTEWKLHRVRGGEKLQIGDEEEVRGNAGKEESRKG
jgi:hypothetical protein